MGVTSDKPLVTFHVIAFNQARFIREAVLGALAQTYRPLEILLSDDCSTDGTFDVMRDTVKDYAGPHTVVLHRNERNLGVSEHTNRLVQQARGELIIAADGDDVSDPQRAARTVEAWLKNGKPAAIVSPVYCIDADGNPSPTRNGDRWFSQFLPVEGESRTECLRRFCKEGSPRLVSCSAAWTKEMFTPFGPLPPDVWYEDDVLTLRAWLYGRIVFMGETLVKYREHDSNIFNRVIPPAITWEARKQAERATATEAHRRRITLLAFLPDLSLAVRRQWITQPVYEELTQLVQSRCAFMKIIEDWWNVGWTARLASLGSVARSGKPNDVRWCGTRLLPLPFFLALGAAWSRARMLGGSLWAMSAAHHALRGRQSMG